MRRVRPYKLTAMVNSNYLIINVKGDISTKIDCG
jgi:hypothetical protein